MSGRGHKSHAGPHRGAPGPNPGFVASKRSVGETAGKRSRDGAPHEGMVLYKGEYVWCKKCSGSASGKDNHSRLGVDPPDPKFPNYDEARAPRPEDAGASGAGSP